MHAFQKIIPELTKQLDKTSTAILIGTHERIPLKKEAFTQTQPKTGPRITFVDAGNGEILKTPNISAQFIRLYATTYENNTRTKRDLTEYYLTITAQQKNLDIEFQTTLYDINGNELEKHTFDAHDPAITMQGRRAEPTTITNHIRKILELKLAQQYTQKLQKGDIIVRDGDLEAKGTILEETTQKLKLSAQQKGIITMGLAKTTTLYTDTGNNAIHALKKIAPQGTWAYHAGGNTTFLKLHPKSQYIFRCDIFTHDKDNLLPAWQALTANSTDPALLGYPYGLIEADKHAQVTKQETEQLRARFAIQSKEAFKNSEQAINAHDILNIL